MKHKTIKLPTWEFNVLVFRGGTEKQVLEHLKRLGVNQKTLNDVRKDDIDNFSRAACWFDTEIATGIMWFTAKTDVATVVHELRHVIDFIFTYIGALEEMEATAYATEWLFNELTIYLEL